MTVEYGRLASEACYQHTKQHLDTRVFGIVDEMLQISPTQLYIKKLFETHCECRRRVCGEGHHCSSCYDKIDTHQDEFKQLMNPNHNYDCCEDDNCKACFITCEPDCEKCNISCSKVDWYKCELCKKLFECAEDWEERQREAEERVKKIRGRYRI